MRPSAFVAGALSCAVLAAGVAQADSAVEVDPLVGTPDSVFHVEVAASFPIRQLRDRYWFVLHGPGGGKCDGTVTDRVGITPPRRATRVAVDLPGVRVVNSRQIVPGPWCEGTFRGHVEFRDWRPRTRRFVTHQIGTFGVRVESGK
jgi:hypothetical protein